MLYPLSYEGGHVQDVEENPLDPGLPFLDVEFICVPGFSLVGKAVSGRNLGCQARWLRIRGATLYKYTFRREAILPA